LYEQYFYYNLKGVTNRKVFKRKRGYFYMEQYTHREFESFMKSMKKMSDVLRSEDPDYIFAPVIGSVPLVDILFITDRHFQLDHVEYPPNSSRFSNREELMQRWYDNFLTQNYHGEKMSIMCIDEVISGSSASKGYIEFLKALDKFGKKEEEYFGKKIKYKILGIGERPKNYKRNRNFTKLVNKKIAKVFETDRIITADNIALNPVRLGVEGLNGAGRNKYLPQIHALHFSQDYLNLLYNSAVYCGTDPDKVSLVNALKISGSLEKYLGTD